MIGPGTTHQNKREAPRAQETRQSKCGCFTSCTPVADLIRRSDGFPVTRYRAPTTSTDGRGGTIRREGTHINELYEVVGTPITGMAHACK